MPNNVCEWQASFHTAFTLNFDLRPLEPFSGEDLGQDFAARKLSAYCNAVGAKISYSKPDMMAGKICTGSPTLGSLFAEKFN